MAMEDPDLDECWGPVPQPDDPKTRKQLLYTNMIIAEWSLSFETRALPEARLRVIANEMFQGHVGRVYWSNARETRLSTSASRRERRFHEILDEEYQGTQPPMTTGRTTATPIVEPAVSVRERLFWMSAGAATVALLRMIRRSHGRR
ncbi:DUF6082 family protein [Actinoallomurus soli]|uniref:DUF6082 family protein n=1 Tax=Actinoallomurus soli TaxID=2952535 RepID=UPI002093811E|nr:DUF6082 family protein [Actinoallomurus soli]MCO5971752.1 DUF6082 family protein [Actinoallomurus soli]